MKYISKLYKSIVLVVCLVILFFEPIVKGIIKERLDFAEIKQYWVDNFKEWVTYWKEYVC